MRDHIVLIGLGKLGFSILEILHQDGTEVGVVTYGARPDRLRQAGISLPEPSSIIATT